MKKLFSALFLNACVLLSAKEIVVVDPMVAGTVRFSVPEGSSTRAERAADNGSWFANQAFVFDVNAGYLIATIQLRKWSASKALDSSDPAVRAFFRPASSNGGRVIGEVKTETFGGARALLQTMEFNPVAGAPAVGARLFKGKSPQEGVPEFKEARFSTRCLVSLGDAFLLFQVSGKDVEQVTQLVKQVCASATHLSAGIPIDSQVDLAPFSVVLEHATVTLTPIGPFKINGALPGKDARRYSGNVLINSLDGSYTIAMTESSLNRIDVGTDDEMRVQLCRGIFAATGGDNAHADGKVIRSAGKTVTVVRQTSRSRDKWDAQCVVLEDGKKVNIFVTANNQGTLDRLLRGILPQ